MRLYPLRVVEPATRKAFRGRDECFGKLPPGVSAFCSAACRLPRRRGHPQRHCLDLSGVLRQGLKTAPLQIRAAKPWITAAALKSLPSLPERAEERQDRGRRREAPYGHQDQSTQNSCSSRPCSFLTDAACLLYCQLTL